MKIVRTLFVVAGMALSAYSPWSVAQDSQPAANSTFTGHIDIDVRKSTPAWPKPVTAPKGAPNVLLVLIDDVGFSTTSTFGGPVDTPVFTQLAANGLRYNEFHVNALCSPSRAALLSGRNSSQIGFGTVAEDRKSVV